MCLGKAKEAFQEQAASLKIATKDLQFSLVCGLRNVKCSATKRTMTFAICLHCGSSQKHEYSLVPLAMRLHFHNTCNSEQSLLYSGVCTELNGVEQTLFRATNSVLDAGTGIFFHGHTGEFAVVFKFISIKIHNFPDKNVVVPSGAERPGPRWVSASEPVKHASSERADLGAMAMI